MLRKVQSSPVLARIVPFAAFALLTLFSPQLGEHSQYWMYAVKTCVGACLLWIVWPHVKEMRWEFSWEAVAVGVLVFLVWVGLDGSYPMMAERSESFNPGRDYGTGSAWALFFIGVRILGSSIIVPPLEEVFYRSFVYRYIQKSDFLKVPLGRFEWKAFLITGVIFGIGHYEWLPGLLCAFAYQGLVCHKNRLGDAMCAHAITNLLLGVWVVWRGDYIFW